MNGTNLSKNNLAYNKIKQEIVNGTLSKDTPVSESILVEKLQISRTPIRSALQKLQTEGFVRIIPNQGVVIKELTLEEANQLFDLRMTLERFLIEKTAPYITEEDIEGLEKIIYKQEIACKNLDFNEFVILDREFHRFSYKHYKNDIMYSILDNCRDRFAAYHGSSLHQNGRMEVIIGEHKEIFQALKSKDVKNAADLVEKHVSMGVMSVLLRY
jgi:DNA-binding GntR family transcriptional regulator